MYCPFCMPDSLINMVESPASSPEFEDGNCSTCTNCGFSLSGQHAGITAVATLALQLKIPEIFGQPNIGIVTPRADNADLVKWGVHLLGADDWFPHETHAAAVENANALNALKFPSKQEDILCFAYAAPWPGDDEDHAHWMAKNYADTPATAVDNAAGA